MFKSARKKLTLSYIGIIMTLMLSISLVVYINVDKFTQRALEKHERRIENRLRDFPRPQKLPEGFQAPFTEEAIVQIRQNTLVLLGIVNSVVLVLAGSFGYWFAGKTLSPIEEMTNKQKKFIGDAAHELKTPLTSIKTQLEIGLRSKKLTSKDFDDLFTSVIEDVDSLSHLVNALLVQSRYLENSSNISRESVNIKILIQEAVSKQKGRLSTANISVIQELENVVARINKHEITELMTILLDNAIKFNKKNGTITISAKELHNKLNIEVSDSGIGIDSKDTPYVFDRFYKADTSRAKTSQEGFGLGLSIAKDIVRRHNGKISLVSEKNKGTTFIVTIPLT